MQEKIVQNIYQFSLMFLLIIIFPVSVLAPIGSWIPLILASIPIFFLKKYKINTLDSKKILIILFFFIIWLIISAFFFNNSLATFEKLLHILILVVSGLYISFHIRSKLHLNNSFILLPLSFILSSLIIILDNKFQIGLKLWLSQNFDFNNFDAFYSFKSWTSFDEFKSNNGEIISRYLHNTYDRGITSLSLLSVPVIAICVICNFKFFATLVFLFCALTIFSLYNLASLFSYIFVALILFFVLYTRKFYINFFLGFVGVYFLFSPFILGNLDYRKFANYEQTLSFKKYNFRHKYLPESCKKNYIKKNSQHLTNKRSMKEYCDAFPSPLLIKNALKLKISKEKFFDILIFSKLRLEDKLIHRRTIWSFTREKIEDKPIFGYGIFSSRSIGENHEVINLYNIKM